MTDDVRIALDPAAIGATLDDIGEIGNRFCGTAGEVQARSYVLERFGELGLADVRLEEFPYLCWQPRPPHVSRGGRAARAPSGLPPLTPTRCSTPRRGP